MKISHAYLYYILSLLCPKQKYSQHHVLKHNHSLFFPKSIKEKVLHPYMARILLLKPYTLQIKVVEIKDF
jgi:hypothetical protein